MGTPVYIHQLYEDIECWLDNIPTAMTDWNRYQERERERESKMIP